MDFITVMLSLNKVNTMNNYTVAVYWMIQKAVHLTSIHTDAQLFFVLADQSHRSAMLITCYM